MNIRRILHIKIHIVLLVAGIIWTTALATESIISEHSNDIVNVLVWVIMTLVGLVFILLQLLITMKLSQLNKSIEKLENDIRAQGTQHGLRIHATELDVANLKTWMRIAGHKPDEATNG